MIAVIKIPFSLEFHKFQQIIIVWCVGALTADLLITSSLVYHLVRPPPFFRGLGAESTCRKTARAVSSIPTRSLTTSVAVCFRVFVWLGRRNLMVGCSDDADEPAHVHLEHRRPHPLPALRTSPSLSLPLSVHVTHAAMGRDHRTLNRRRRCTSCST